MGVDGRKKCMLILAAFIVLCAIIPSAQSENYICIGNCEATPTPVLGNQPPVLDSIADQEVPEGSLLTFSLHASDPEENIAYFTADIPEGAGIALSGTTFLFSWTPDYSQAGYYYANFSITDSGGLTDHQNVLINVIDVNRLPIFANPLNPKVAENVTLIFNPEAMDPDGDPVTLDVVSSLPNGAQFSANTGDVTWTPDFTQAGNYVVNFSASDGDLISYLQITITVTNLNRPPVLVNPGSQEIRENDTLGFTLHATDADGEPIIYGSVAPLPYGAVLNPVSGAFAWTPAYGQNGIYAINFTATDGIDIVYARLGIMVIGVNRPPVLANPGDKGVAENATLNFSLSAIDPDGDPVTYGNSTSLPLGASLNTSTGNFIWTPSFGQHGSYLVNFSANDGDLYDYKSIAIVVSDVNGPPILATIGNRATEEGLLLTFTVSASDPDGDLLTFNATPLPERAMFNTTTRVFSWIPSYSQAGTYRLNFSVRDPEGLTDYEVVTIQVSEPSNTHVSTVDYAPVFDPVPVKLAAETYELTFSIHATDYDSTYLIYSAVYLPVGASFNPSTRVFSWTPAYRSTGMYTAKFSVSDGKTSDVLTVTFTVVDQPMPTHDCIQD
jgi:hypothetical protein